MFSRVLTRRLATVLLRRRAGRQNRPCDPVKRAARIGGDEWHLICARRAVFCRALLKWLRLPTNPELHAPAMRQQLRHLELVLREHEAGGNGDSDGGSGARARVTAEWFGAVVNWFGPLDGDFLKRVGSMGAKNWFHGHLGGSQANRILTGRADGVYLVRLSGEACARACGTKRDLTRVFSATEPGFFTISCMHKGKVTHIRIVHKPCSGEYTLGAGRAVYRSVAELLEKEQSALGLLVACPGSQFAPTEEVNGYIVNY